MLNSSYKQINLNYKIYLKAKFINIINREITLKAISYLDKIAIDLYGLIILISLGRKKFIIFFIDLASRLINFKLLNFKSEAF